MKKKYSKASIKVDEVFDINESVLMYTYGSGDWYDSNCYAAFLQPKQDAEIGRTSYVLQVDAEHRALDNHTNNNQLFIFVLDRPLPQNVSGTIFMDSTYPIEIMEPERTRFRIFTGYHQNIGDMIGSGGVEVTFTNWPADKSLADYYPYDCEVWDTKWREYS